MAKEGYTRTGKSLKAVRRYYALQNAKKEAEKVKLPAEEDKLSNRIAAELKAQQDANQKRPKSPNLLQGLDASDGTGTGANTGIGTNTGAATAAPDSFSAFGAVKTDRTGLPDGVVMSPKQTGPVFTTADPLTAKKLVDVSAKSTKSLKSARSAGISMRYPDGDRASGSFEAYCLGGIMTEAIVFLVTFLYLFLGNSDTSNIWKQEIDVEVKWMGFTSIFVLLSALYWAYKRNQFFHAILSLVIMILSGVSTVILLATSRNYTKAGVVESSHKSVFDIDVHIVFILIISYFILQLIVTALMILHIISLLSRQVIERSGRTEYQGNMIVTGNQA